jgi:hypothetical protein
MSQPTDPQDIFNDKLVAGVFDCQMTGTAEYTIDLGPGDLESACLAIEQLKDDKRYEFSFEQMHRVLRVKIK